MLCSSDHIGQHQPQLVQMGTAAASSSTGWAQRMMPATNSASSPSTATATAAAAAASSSTVGAKAMAHQQQQPAGGPPQRCPRCDSSNTKFCYYNNYSLSQPRHFCKACKRYWTRGGTLRNVPVGGGCRKNKRVKKQTPHAAAAPAGPTTVRSGQQPQPSLVPPSSAADLSSLFYASSSDMNLGSLPYDCLGAMGGLLSDSNPSPLINASLANLRQQPVSPYSFFDYDYSSLLASSMKHHQSNDGMQQANLGFLKEAKVEGDGNLLCSSGNFMSTDQWGANNYAFEAISGGDASCLEYWNPAMGGGGGGWPDAANPSVAPLI